MTNEQYDLKIREYVEQLRKSGYSHNTFKQFYSNISALGLNMIGYMYDDRVFIFHSTTDFAKWYYT